MEGLNHHQGSTMTTRIVCAVCFLTLSFLWLYWFQGDLLAVAQHSLSGGVTHYERTIGAVLITLALLLLQLAVHGVTRLSRFTHALTYGPSFLGLAFLSDITIVGAAPDVCPPSPGVCPPTVTVGHLWWLLALLLVLWGVAVWLAREMMPFGREENQSTGLFSSRTWANLLQMAAMMLVVAAIGNTNAVDHFKAHAEIALMCGDDDEALRVGEKSLETDAHLTMLRAYALSRRGLMGERLFSYPIAGTSEDLLPSRHRPLILPAETIWKHLGARPAFPMKAQRFFHCLKADSLASRAVADYELCSLLIDRKLDAFVRLLPSHYDITAHLPRHYREALVLYAHKHSAGAGRDVPQMVDDEMEQEWQQMQQLKSQYPEGSAQQLKMLEQYRHTYWYYYN